MLDILFIKRPSHHGTSSSIPVALRLALCLMLTLPVLVEASDASIRQQVESTRKAIAEGRDANADPRAISDIYLLGAGKCRDLGASKETMTLFAKAVKADPENTRAWIVFGDYLMGYRGLYEYAAESYYKALALIEKSPHLHDTPTKQHLERSFQILHRDGKDGVPLYTSPQASIFLRAGGSYGKTAVDPLTQVNMQLSAAANLDARASELTDGIAFTKNAISMNKSGVAFFEENIELNKSGIDFFQDQYQGTLDHDAFLESLLVSNGGTVFTRDEVIDFKPDGTPITINSAQAENVVNRAILGKKVSDIKDDKAANQSKIGEIKAEQSANETTKANQTEELNDVPEKKKALKRKIPRRRDVLSYEAELLIRFGPTALPYLKFSWAQIETDDVSINPEDLNLDHLLDGTFERHAVVIGKNYRLPKSIDLLIELEGAHIKNTIHDDFNNRRFAKEETDQLSLLTEITFTALRFRTVKLKLGGSVADIENDDSRNDSGHSLLAAVRYSSFNAGENTVQSDLFRGRRSTHIEAGLSHRERDFKSSVAPTVTESVIQPYISYEELGLHNGWLDLTTVYSYRSQDVSRGRLDGRRDIHRVSITPAFVPVYRLYDSDFWTGLEHLTIGFPQVIEWVDGECDRVSTGIQIFGHYVTPFGFSLTPTVTGSFAYYTEASLSDWGVFAKCIIESGAKRKLKKGTQ